MELKLSNFLESFIDELDDMKRVIENKKTPMKGVFLFFSFDLADSTQFKTEHPELWSSVFRIFYEETLMKLNVEGYRGEDVDEVETEDTCEKRLWKLIGDEVLVYIQIRDWNELYTQVSNVSEIAPKLIETIAKRAKDSCNNRVHNIENIIKWSLGVKVTAWIADCCENNLSAPHQQQTNIIYKKDEDSDNLDFIGRDIDEGFRIAKFAVKNKVIVSPLLAWLIWKNTENDKDKRKIIEDNFKIISFVTLKGVWKNRKVPILMFDRSFKNFRNEIAYDDLDKEVYNKVKEIGIDKFYADKACGIERVDKILSDVYRHDDAIKMYDSLKNSAPLNKKLIRTYTTELHVAVILLDNQGVVVHKDSVRGWEFGCVPFKFNHYNETLKKICQDGYKMKYNLSIELSDNPIPVATYNYKKSSNHNVIGFIVIGKILEREENYPKDWKYMTFEKIKTLNDKNCVEGFKKNIEIARNLKDRD